MKTYKKIFDYLGRMKAVIVTAIVCSGLAPLITLYGYRNIDLFFRQLVIEEDAHHAVWFAKVIVIAMASGFAVYFVSVFMTHIAAFRLETVLRKKGLDGLSKAGFSFFDRNSSGKVRKIIDDNAAQTHMAVAHLIPDIVSAVMMPVGILILGYLVDLKVGIVLSVMTVLSFILMVMMMGNTDFIKMYQQYLEKLSAETVEYVRGMQVVKVFGTGIESFSSFHRCIKEYSHFALEYSMSCKWPYTLFQLLFFGIMAVVVPIWIAGENFGDNGKITSVNLIMLIFLSGVFFVAFMKIMYVGMYVQLAGMAIEKLESLYTEMEESSIAHGQETEFENFNIEFKNVDFSYGDNKVLENFSLSLKEDRVYAFAGGSGSGKSTVAKLLAGFYKVDGGEITIGEKNILDYSEEALMKNISIVFQNPKLFKKTIYENVKIGNPEATDEEIMTALKLAGCSDIIEKFPDGVQTVIGSRGVYLSGGEKQRITIARAILKDARIVILDEASGAIDPENEYAFQKAFSNLMRGKTVIMIAHRLSSIRGADEILVMENGRVIEAGSHQQLMGKNGRYGYYQKLHGKTNEWRVQNG